MDNQDVAQSLLKLAKSLTAGFHPKDDLLRGITFEELIDTVYSNEQTRDEKAVKKVFEELLKASVAEARSELRRNLKEIVKSADQE